MTLRSPCGTHELACAFALLWLMVSASPLCCSYKGCLAAASFMQADTEVSGAYYAIITVRLT